MSEFINSLTDVFQDFGQIYCKKMFGGYGVYHEGLMFALVSDDEIFLKADEQNKSAFEALGLKPFTYHKKGKAMKMSYRQAPSEIFDDNTIAAVWAKSAYAAALRSRKNSFRNFL